MTLWSRGKRCAGIKSRFYQILNRRQSNLEVHYCTFVLVRDMSNPTALFHFQNKVDRSFMTIMSGREAVSAQMSAQRPERRREQAPEPPLPLESPPPRKRMRLTSNSPCLCSQCMHSRQALHTQMLLQNRLKQSEERLSLQQAIVAEALAQLHSLEAQVLRDECTLKDANEKVQLYPLPRH